MSAFTKPRTRFFLNEQITAIRLIEILLHNHLVLQDSTGTIPLIDRSLPNTISKSVALLLINFLHLHSNIPNNKLLHLLRNDFTPLPSSNSLSSPTTTNFSQNEDEPTLETTFDTTLPLEDLSSLSQQPQQPPEQQPEQQPQQQPQPQPQPQQQLRQQPTAPQFSCQTCCIDFASVVIYRQHLRSPEHQQNLRQKGSSSQSLPQHIPEPQAENALPTNAEDALLKHIPSLLTFASGTKDDQIDNNKAKTSSKQHDGVINHVYHQHERDDGVFDFKYGAKTQDDEDEGADFPLPNQRKAKRNSTTSHSPKSRVRSTSNSRNTNTGANNSKQFNQHNDSDSSDSSDDEGENTSFDPLGLQSSSQSNNTNQKISNKPGIPLQLISIPTNSSENFDDNQPVNGPKVIQLTKLAHPQHIILTSPLIGSLVIPASSATMSSIQSANLLEDASHDDHTSSTSIATITTRQLPFIQALLWQFLSSLSQTTPIKTFPSPNINIIPSNLTAIIFDSGGKFAFSLMLGNIILYHTSFSNYTTRKKQGKQQSSHDKSGGHANSVGATIRRQQTLRHRERIRETLYHLRAELFYCNQILLYVPSHHMKEQLFMNPEQLAKWAQSGGAWIGSSSLPLHNHTSQQIQHQAPNRISTSTAHNNMIINSSIADPNDQDEHHVQLSSNFAFFTTQRDNFQNLPNHPLPYQFPPTKSIQLPNVHSLFQQKYSLAFNHLQSSQNQKTINQQTGQYQMMYFNKMTKKNKLQQQRNQLTAFDPDEDSEDDDDDVDHNITLDWHKDTLMYYINQQVQNKDFSSSSSSAQPISLTNQINSQIVYVDQFTTNISSSHAATPEFSIDSSGIYPPTINTSLQLPQAHTTPEHHTSLPYILSHLQSSTFQPITYNIRPYHSHFYKANFTQQQQEHLYLLHPYDPRIQYLGVNIHDAKHHEILRLFQELMLCKIKPHASTE